MPWMIPAAMVGTSLLNGGIQAGQAAAERKRQAAMTRYSPWTGQAGHTVQDPNVFGGAVQGGLGGLAMQQNMDKADQQKQLADAWIQKLKGDTELPKSQGLQNASADPNSQFHLTDSSVNPSAASKYSLGVSQPTGSAGALQGAGQGVMDPSLVGGLGLGANALMSSAPGASASLWDMLGTGLAAG